MIKGIGLFHFGDPDKRARIKSLRNSLIEASRERSLENCLIVIPEAFNICGGYRDDPPRPIDFSMQASLVTISKEFKVAFVAGLIVSRAQGPKYNCAYLIDGTICHLLSCKEQSDGTNNYAPCVGDHDNPYLYHGVWVSALICLDAGMSDSSERSKRIRGRMKDYECKEAILCIPADTLSIDTRLTAQRWTAHFHTIVANSNASPSSVIHMKTAAQSVLVQGCANRIEIVDL